MGHDPRLQRRRPFVFLDNAADIDPALPEFIHHPVAHGIPADHAGAEYLPPHGINIVQDVGTSPQEKVVRLDLHHRHGGLRGDAGHAPPDEMVHHDVAHHQDFRPGETVDDRYRPFFRQDALHIEPRKPPGTAPARLEPTDAMFPEPVCQFFYSVPWFPPTVPGRKTNSVLTSQWE